MMVNLRNISAKRVQKISAVNQVTHNITSSLKIKDLKT